MNMMLVWIILIRCPPFEKDSVNLLAGRSGDDTFSSSSESAAALSAPFFPPISPASTIGSSMGSRS